MGTETGKRGGETWGRNVATDGSYPSFFRSTGLPTSQKIGERPVCPHISANNPHKVIRGAMRVIGRAGPPFPRRCFNLRLPHPCALCKGGSEEARQGYPTLAFSGLAGSFPVSHGCSPDCGTSIRRAAAHRPERDQIGHRPGAPHIAYFAMCGFRCDPEMRRDRKN